MKKLLAIFILVFFASSPWLHPARAEVSGPRDASSSSDGISELTQRLSDMPKKASFDERYTALRPLLDELLQQQEPPPDSDDLVEFLHQQGALLLLAPNAASRNGETVTDASGRLQTARADIDKLAWMWRKAKASARTATRPSPQSIVALPNAVQTPPAPTIEQSSIPAAPARAGESDASARMASSPPQTASGGVAFPPPDREHVNDAPQAPRSAPQSSSAAPRPSSSSTNSTVTTPSATPKEEATSQKTLLSYIVLAWATIVILGIALGFTHRIVVYRDFDDLGLLFLMPVTLIFGWILGNVVSGPLVQNLASFLIIAIELGLFAYVTWRTCQDNSSWWEILVALVTKISLGFLFALHLFTFINSKRGSQGRRSDLFWILVLTPIVYGLVKNKVGFWAPHDSLNSYRRRQLGI